MMPQAEATAANLLKNTVPCLTGGIEKAPAGIDITLNVVDLEKTLFEACESALYHSQSLVTVFTDIVPIITCVEPPTADYCRYNRTT
ncbi:unnamed protein product [Cuscuta europaea]|uniref:Uncharacterized protein n=1 Tax=Cuscuta europaea TaxID=41803 RepID=A0A9P1DYS9_CUSEU|nr:unnamed protein product [Cuscuta europaea]